MEYVEELESVPEPEHVEQVMDGLLDTVSGTEGFTKAQYYLEGVLYSNGMIRHRDVGGTEGILSKVGDGVKAAIEYVKKMFRSIWDFFFKSEKKQIEENLGKELTTAFNSLEKTKNPIVTPANVNAALDKVEVKVNKLKDGPEKTKLKEKVKEAKESKDEGFKIKIVEVMPGEIFQAYKVPDIISEVYQAKFNVALEGLQALQDQHKDEGKQHVIIVETQKILNAGKALPKDANRVSTIEGAASYLKEAKKCADEICRSLDNLQRTESEFKTQIKNLDNAKSDEETRKSVGAMKTSLMGISTLIHETKVLLRYLESVAKNINKGCTMVV